MAEQPKKSPSAYFLWLNDNRAAIAKELGNAKGSEVTKKGGEMWKNLPAAKKAPYEAKAAAAKATYDKEKESFQAQGGVITRKRKADKPEKKKKDPNAPKKPAGGAYGVYMAKHRAAIVKSLPAGSNPITDVAKAAGAKFSALSEAEKKPYNDEYLKKVEAYKKAMESYVGPAEKKEEANAKKAKKGKKGDEDEAPASPVKKAKTEAKAASLKAKSPKAKAKVAVLTPKAKGRAAPKPEPKAKAKGKAGGLAVIDPAVLAAAEKEGLGTALRNLASRDVIMERGLPASAILSALKEAEGLVNKAKAILLGGA